jgi:hypothetical protein
LSRSGMGPDLAYLRLYRRLVQLASSPFGARLLSLRRS